MAGQAERLLKLAAGLLNDPCRGFDGGDEAARDLLLMACSHDFICSRASGKPRRRRGFMVSCFRPYTGLPSLSTVTLES
jgi:hypothetical protein